MTRETGPVLVAPYCGQNQPQVVVVPDTILYRENWEESCWVMPAYTGIFPDVPNDQFPPAPVTVAGRLVPPPIYKTDLWSAMQTWPL